MWQELVPSIFFFNDTSPTEIYTLSLRDALPISGRKPGSVRLVRRAAGHAVKRLREVDRRDRKSTRLNSSHDQISYAVFCLKKKNNCPTALMPLFARTTRNTNARCLS